MGHALEIEGLTVELGGRRVLEDVTLTAAQGEMLVLLGPSGCGKSTLLRSVAGLVPPRSGTIRIGGGCVDDLDPGERDVAMVFQSYALYPHLTVLGNLEFPLRRARLPAPERAARVAESVHMLALEGLLERKPAQLSGGQMQRVALGRALVRRPRLFLFDEPLSNLDARLRAELRGEIAVLHARLGVTALYVTHDQAEAMTLGTRIAVLESGHVVQVGPRLDVFREPATTFVAGFVGSPAMNLLPGRVRAGTLEIGTSPGERLRIPGVEVADRDGIEAGIRPHDVDWLRGGGGGPTFVVARIEHLGTECVVELELGALRLRAALPPSEAPRVGDPGQVRIRPESVHLFDGATGKRLTGRAGGAKRVPSEGAP